MRNWELRSKPISRKILHLYEQSASADFLQAQKNFQTFLPGEDFSFLNPYFQVHCEIDYPIQALPNLSTKKKFFRAVVVAHWLRRSFQNQRSTV